MKELQSIVIPPYGVKITVEDVDAFLTEAITIYYQLFTNNVQQILYYERKIKEATGLRKMAIQNILEASEHNALLIKEIVDSLMPHTKVDHLLKYKYQQGIARGSNNLDAYLKDFKYLRRDWCGNKEGEAQIQKILKAVKPAIKKHAESTEKALFLGAGLGRIAWEHTDIFGSVCALDKSYSMAYHFQKLLEKDIEFHEIHAINMMKALDCTIKHTGSIKNGYDLDDKSKFEYIVGDVTTLPFKNNSLDCIVSVYFTDVIALKLYFKEIVRTLKPGGLFIHFGPLDYFFSDIMHTLSAEEIKQKFLDSGFKVIIDENIGTTHLESKVTLNKKYCNNWFCIIKKGSE